jgi:hypothetical protein
LANPIRSLPSLLRIDSETAFSNYINHKKTEPDKYIFMHEILVKKTYQLLKQWSNDNRVS